MSLRPVRWHSATTRLILIYGALFVGWGVILMAIAQWQATRYLDNVIDQLLMQRMHYLATTDASRLSATVDAASTIDPHGVMSVGLFDPRGKSLAGNISRMPESFKPDGRIYLLANGVPRSDHIDGEVRARAMADVLPNGDVLVLAKDISTIDGIGATIRRSLGIGISLTLIPGLLGGLLLRRGPARRLRELQQATDPIRRGDLSRRLPQGRGNDEVDALAGIVNSMLDEIERLMNEVKGVCDNIAHDLRTPLTRLRAQLYRARQQVDDGAPTAGLLDACTVDIDALLARFRALLRVSELEDRNRCACFGEVELAQVLRQVHEFYAPMAEDRGQPFLLELEPMETVRGDRQLLFEALANVVGNAIKFTPTGGAIWLRGSMDSRGPRIDVIDSGPGIPAHERAAVTRRFYRGDNNPGALGSGLGLSIVSAIIRLHGFALDIDQAGTGARISIHAYPVRPGDLSGTCLSRNVVPASAGEPALLANMKISSSYPIN